MNFLKSSWWWALTLTLLYSGYVLVLPNYITRADFQIFLPIIIKAPYEPEKGVSLAYPNCEDLTALGAGWYYNNLITPSAGCPLLDQRFVPRIHNSEQTTAIAITTAISNAKVSGWLMGFTEPNLPWQGNTTPLAGAQAWRAIEAAALPAGIKLVAPSPSQHNPGYYDPLGYTWIWKMVDEYQGLYGEKPHFDAMGWNYYESNSQAIKNFLTARRNEALARGYDVPFWVTEYGGRCWDTGHFPTGNETIMTQVTPWLKSVAWITRYAWFSNRIKGNESWGPNWQSCSLVNSNTGALTSLGGLYVGY
jgi:hypothetical protein